eukprot:Protomagalhaensia_sp_Gyna_25__4821@NODE_494_length_3271_cov_42_301980_g385_i0_p1_GENE_NODE_494_length_3271_cov_42_301980_g385_i0NODE_494_length_3271_cov_42_301980_g385_i0_p1_ORF_typecomplete_len508_score68_18Hexokinase_2/PF03727_16/9_3e48Hexokinase_1/PF00349_21/1_2e43ROK/PF00480_20/0_0011BcrAD_BadFG/PF01869_20/1_2BcrAD_BadFG/PF01869_20/0_24_NODE_494_length_3271_cov_42_301980_g385_i0721595
MSFKIERQQVTIEPLEERAKRYLDLFKFTPEIRNRMMEAFNSDVHICKVHHKHEHEPAGDMYFLDTCVDRPPTGNETGIYYAVDFGGTNIRAVRVELGGDPRLKMDQLSKMVSELPTKDNLKMGLMDPKATATELFDNMAWIVKELMEKHGDDKEKTIFKTGFTFSFAMNQKDIDSAEAITLSKGFLTGRDTQDPVVAKGTDIVLLLNSAFARNRVPAEATAVLNDTTGTLMSGAYMAAGAPDKPPTMIGLIVGTGLNACYADPDATAYGYLGSIINTEIGSLAKGLPRNIIDHEVDDADARPNFQITEKMISGYYLPELCRRAILKVYQEAAPPLAWTHFSLSTEACLAMAYEEDSNYPLVQEVMQSQLQWDLSKLSKRDFTLIHELCYAVLKRAAELLGVLISGLARHTGRLQPALGGLTVAVTGSVFTKNPKFQEDVRASLEATLTPERANLIHFQIAQDGSGIGAAVIAALPHQHRKATFAPSPGTVFERRLSDHLQHLENKD